MSQPIPQRMDFKQLYKHLEPDHIIFFTTTYEIIVESKLEHYLVLNMIHSTYASYAS